MTKPNADKVAVNSSGFSGNLTAAENDVQKALVKVDQLVLGSGGGASGSGESDATLTKGTPVYIKGNGHIDSAKADASGTSTVVGLLMSDVLATISGDFQADGNITLADWTAVIGAATLTIGSIYYLSATSAGMLTTTAPTAVGEYVCRVGMAISTTTLAIEIDPKILL
jgi:hypothetical protein